MSNNQLQPILSELVQRLADKYLVKTPFEIIIKPELPISPKGKDTLILIKAGNPPVICVSELYLRASLSNTNTLVGLHSLKDSLLWALEKLPKLYHTLSLVPIAEAIALREGARKWIKTTAPYLRTEIDKKRLILKNISVTLEDSISGTTITRNGLDYNDLLHRCHMDLSKLIIEDEDKEEWIERMKDIERVKKLEVPPNEISMSYGNDGTTEVNMRY